MNQAPCVEGIGPSHHLGVPTKLRASVIGDPYPPGREGCGTDHPDPDDLRGQ